MISDIIDCIKTKNWKEVATYIGSPLDQNKLGYFGATLTERVELVSTNQKLTEIRYWEGNNWSLDKGYNSPNRVIR